MARALSEVAALLDQMAIEARDEAARLAAFPRASLTQGVRAQLLAGLAADVRCAMTGRAPLRAAVARLDALAFWRAHGKAVAAVGAVYGLGWACRAPLGETVLATVPGGLRSHKTEQGTVLRWKADHRMPAGQYWPGGSLPDGLVLTPDTPRHVPGVHRAVSGVYRRKVAPALEMTTEQEAAA